MEQQEERGWISRLMHYLNPTSQKEPEPEAKANRTPAKTEDENEIIAVLSAALAAYDDDADEIVAVMAAALASYGYSLSQIRAIRPLVGRNWSLAARLGSVRD